MKNKRFCALIIMDGFGLSPEREGNAIELSGIPRLKGFLKEYPHTKIEASGLEVGLPEGQIGNSEVGHLNLGAGRVVYQDITRIDKSIKDGDFFANPAFLAAINNVKERGTALHLVGLLSDGGVHSSLNHLFALIDLAKAKGVEKLYIHCLMDGRDVPPTSGAGFIARLKEKLTSVKLGEIASVMGRYYFMDRDNRWERVEQGFNCMFAGAGAMAADAKQAVEKCYVSGITDEFVTPTSVYKNGAPVATVRQHDSVIFFNFRSDRAREVSRAILEKDFKEFERKNGFVELCYVGLTQYDATFKGILTAYPPRKLTNTFGEYIAAKGFNQLRIAETEKYAHVTFFFNGGEETPNKGEKRILVPSPKVATYDLQPEMSAYGVTEKALAEIEAGEIDVMVLNFANCDMVGHTGVLAAAQKAAAVVDECVGKIVDKILSAGGAAIITADHGNAEQMFLQDGSPCTAHTTNPVPFLLCDDTRKGVALKEGGSLADVIPTLLELMGVEQPEEMEGKSMICG